MGKKNLPPPIFWIYSSLAILTFFSPFSSIFAKVVQSKNPLRKFFENVFRDLRFGGNFRKETVFKKSEKDGVFLLFQKLFQRVFALNDFLKKACFFDHFDPLLTEGAFCPLFLGGSLFSFHIRLDIYKVF